MALSKKQARNAFYLAVYKSEKDAQCVAQHGAGWKFVLSTNTCVAP